MDLASYFAMLRRRALVIVLCLIAGGAGGFDLGHRGAKVYSATAQCLVNIPAANNIQTQLAGSQLSSNLVATYASLATSRAIGAQVVTSLGLHEAPSAISGALSASNETGTYLISISATDRDPHMAQRIANAAAAALSVTVQKFGSGVGGRVSVQVANTAQLPTAPIRPRPKLDLALGLIFGLLAGLAVAAMIEALDRTVKSSGQADALLEAPLLGFVPKRRGHALVLGHDVDRPEGEPYRSLRTAVRFLDPDKPLRSILITSPTPGDGKTTTAANLAVALALSGERVIIVDGDLRRASLAEVFGLERAIGLTSLVVGKATLDEVLQDWGRNLQVLASGPLPPNPSEILGSARMNRVIRDLVARADVVIIDAPPILPVADAVALGAQVDGVVVVVRHGVTVRHAAAESRRRLESVGARIVGYVFNAVPLREARGYYADYRYDYGRRRRRGRTKPATTPTENSIGSRTGKPPRRHTDTRA